MQNPNSYSTDNNRRRTSADTTQPEPTRAYGRRTWGAAQGQDPSKGQTQAQATQAYTAGQRQDAAAQGSYLNEELDHEAFPETHPFRPVSSDEASYRQTSYQQSYQQAATAQSRQQAQPATSRLSQVDDSKVAGRVAYDSDGNLVVVKKEEKSSPVQMAAIVGSALSAVTSAFFSSHIGIGGSVLTVAIGAAVSAAATQLYTHLIQKSTDKVKHLTQGAGGHQQLDGVMDSSQLDGGYGYDAEPASVTSYEEAVPDEESEAQAKRIRKRGIIIVAIAALIAVIAAAGVVTLATNGEGIGTKTPSIIATQPTDTTDDTSDADDTTKTTTTTDDTKTPEATTTDEGTATTTTTDTSEDSGTGTSGSSSKGTVTVIDGGSANTPTTDSGSSSNGSSSSSNGSSSNGSGTSSNSSSSGSSTNTSGTSGSNSSSSGSSTDSGNSSSSTTSGTTDSGSTASTSTDAQ